MSDIIKPKGRKPKAEELFPLSARPVKFLIFEGNMKEIYFKFEGNMPTISQES